MSEKFDKKRYSVPSESSSLKKRGSLKNNLEDLDDDEDYENYSKTNLK